MKPFFQKHHRLIFFSLWIILGLIQASLTELQDDEAYYWVYSRFPDWGYFDHPPMIAMLIKFGYAIFPNELGVRLFPLLLNVGSLLIIEKLINKKNPLLFYTIALSIAVLQITGFVAVPDIPLIFFTALFFWCYKRFIEKLSFFNTVIVGVSIALLFYSKYHAILIVLFTLLSNVKLFTKYQVYVAGIIALLLFAPHLWWQYQHGWVSIKYHLFESNVNAYKFSFTFDYIIGQLLFPGPIAGFILLPAAFLYKPTDKLEKAMRFTMIGIYIFFLLSSFRGKVEGNWTSPALVCVFILAYQYLNENPKWFRVLFRLVPVTIILVMIARIAMIADILPIKAIRERYHAWKDWPQQMKETTKGLPIVFSNSYQRASKYWFYTGQMTYSQNWYRERRNNYNFWPVEDSLLGKPVYFLDRYKLYRFKDSVNTPIGYVSYEYDSSFTSFAKVTFLPAQTSFTVEQGNSINLKGVTEMPSLYSDFIATHPSVRSLIRVAFFNDRGWIKDWIAPVTLQQLSAKQFDFTFDPALPKGKYFMRFAIEADYNITHNSDKITLIVK